MPVLAIGGVELVALLVALFVLLLIAALWVQMHLLKSVLSHVWLVGAHIAGAIEHWLAHAMSDAVNWMADLAMPVVHFLWAVTVAPWHLVYRIVLGIADAKGTALAALGEAGRAIGTAESYADSAVAQLSGTLGNDITALEGDIAGVAAGIGATVAGAVATALLPIEGTISDVQSEANRLFGTAESDIASGVAQAEAFAQGLADSVQSEAVRLFGTAESDITAVGDQVAALPGIIEGALPGELVNLLPEALVGAGLGALLGVIPRVAALEATTAECTEPLCDTVTPQAKRLGNLGKIFQGLEDLALVGFLFALCEEAVAHPEAVVEDTVSVYNAVLEPVVTGFRDAVPGA